MEQHPDGKMGKGEFRDMMEKVDFQINFKVFFIETSNEGSPKQRCKKNDAPHLQTL